MRTLYQEQDLVSNDFPSIRAKNTNEFRGAARGVAMSRIFCDLLQFSTIISAVAQTCAITNNLHHTCKKDLTRNPVAGIMAQGNPSVLHIAFALAQTCCFEKNFVHTRKKDLTTVAFARILAQEPLRFRTSLSHWRPRAKIPKKSSPRQK